MIYLARRSPPTLPLDFAFRSILKSSRVGAVARKECSGGTEGNSSSEGEHLFCDALWDAVGWPGGADGGRRHGNPLCRERGPQDPQPCSAQGWPHICLASARKFPCKYFKCLHWFQGSSLFLRLGMPFPLLVICGLPLQRPGVCLGVMHRRRLRTSRRCQLPTPLSSLPRRRPHS